jgi:hypothetical protein
LLGDEDCEEAVVSSLYRGAGKADPEEYDDGLSSYRIWPSDEPGGGL